MFRPPAAPLGGLLGLAAPWNSASSALGSSINSSATPSATR
jgi:hypothetical protein